MWSKIFTKNLELSNENEFKNKTCGIWTNNFRKIKIHEILIFKLGTYF